MESLRLENYRKFSDTGDIFLKPLTLLVGANSSGKSSFLKFFPLVKQTVKRHANGVFLWYADDVDFKDFDNTVKDGGKEIVINFIANSAIYGDFSPCNVWLRIAKLSEKRDYLKSLAIQINDIFLEVSFPSNFYQDGTVQIVINGSKYEIGNCKVLNMRPIIPTLLFVDKKEEAAYDRPFLFDEMMKKLFEANDEGLEWRLRRAFQHRTEIREMVSRTFPENVISQIDDWKRIEDCFIIQNINRYLESIAYYLEALADNVTYIQPLRAMAERYYRIQNMAIDEIDSQGDNLAMFLHSLDKGKQDKFSKWLEERFGFKLAVLPSGGHIELIVEEKNKDPKNMVDVGFGYSQMLPILASIWNALCNKSPRRRFFQNHLFKKIPDKIVVIEQPELHLHPRFISLFANTIIQLLKEFRNVKFIIETHSETIVNVIGKIISTLKDEKAENKTGFSEEDVSIVLFNADEEGYDSNIIQTGYDNEGYLKEWPYGFFSGDVY